MAISFNDIPAAVRTPFAFVEFDGSSAVRGPQILNYRALLIGQKLAGGSAAVDVPVLVTSAAQARALFGAGSVLSGMFDAWFAQNRLTEVWGLPVADSPAGVAATGSITLGGTAIVSGTLSMMIAGRLVRVAVASGNTASAIATAAAAAVNADTSLPVTASALSGTVTLTARNKGETGNDIDVRVNYYDGEATPDGLTATITAMSDGATNPTLAAGIAALGDDWFQIIGLAFRDAANLETLKAEMDSRWGPVRQIDGHVIAAASGSVAEMTTFGSGLNDKHLTVVATQKSPTPAYEVAAETAGIASYYASIDPARPLQMLAYQWMKAPARPDRHTLMERNTCLYTGIATVKLDGSTVVVERLISTYQINAAGGNDVAYLSVEPLLTLQYIRWDWRNYIQRKYPRHKLADDGTRYAPGQAIVTPLLMKAEAVSKFTDWESQGLVEGFAQFKRDLISERNAGDRDRLDLLMAPDLVNQFRILGTKIAWLL